LRPRAQLRQGNKARLLDQSHLDVDPARRVKCRFWIVIRTLLVELRLVGVRGLADLHDAGYAGLGAARMVEKCEIADLHLVAHEVSCLIISNAVPSHRLLRHASEMIDG